MKITKLKQISSACPSQWEGKLETGEDIYIRYRWGIVRIDINGQPFYRESLGDDLDGTLSTKQLKHYLLHFKNIEFGD